MSAPLNDAALRAIKNALSNVEDNLYRYRNFGPPDTLTGNGETFASVIAKLEAERDSLREALAPFAAPAAPEEPQ